MLVNIKSNKIKKQVFSYLDNKPKLRIIINNKKIQNVLNIDINDYKKFNNCILSIDKNGKGVISSLSDNNLILFEGEYSNKKGNGKGIQYYNGEIIFEGIYKDGQKWNGKIKEHKLVYPSGNTRLYDNDKKLIYEGEYMNIIVKRKPQEYIYQYKLEFDGEYINGKFNGIMKKYNSQEMLLFEGKYVDGINNGDSIKYDESGNWLLKGEFPEGKIWNGQIRSFHTNGVLSFEGEFINGDVYGKGN